ncbi:uracil phosphoribosyltransferase [Rubrivivax gelatinosus]|uniref:DUF1688 family protein n=1 Tax=Rubrivivax gelatinosus TaxID=28068 RepID=UPI00190421CE|nr:DUF1688 family protein [Rubrivivax gelatinosus]MBK1612890.1 uracil phosphoribosyltransferase [Rubrivivax gelatinosus]
MTEILATLRDPATIRLRCAAITQAVADDRSGWFRLDRSRLDEVAERVAALTRERFPDGRIPLHSRWRHFEAGGVDRRALLDASLAGVTTAERARAYFDLVVVSVLLDAGAGPAWSWREGEGDGATRYSRSEGLGVASFRAFLAGAFAFDAAEPLRADAAALRRLDAAALGAIFQVTPTNTMVGLDGRAALLVRLGETLAAESGRSGFESRPGLLYDQLVAGGRDAVTASEILGLLLRVLAPVWTSGSSVAGQRAGDVWPHRFADASAPGGGIDRRTPGWLPLHKLSQWLAYSLIEPLQWCGVRVTGLDALTGLPEYRNGGLLIDAGVVVPRDPRSLATRWKPSDEFVIEWRALTVTLLDEVAERVRARLGLGAEQLPLACVLEGGTWAAGRQIALERRADGSPPVAIDSDGTIF